MITKKPTRNSSTTPPSTVPLRLTITLLLLLGISTANTLHAQSISRTLDDFQGWTITSQPEPGTPEFELSEIRRSLADENYREAERKADAWIEAHPNHEFIAEAYVARGEAKQARKEYYKALFDYEFVARSYPGSEAFRRALEHEFEIAKLFANGVKRKLWGMRITGAKEEAEELFIRLQERLPGSELAERAGRELADYYYRNRDMHMAATAYDLYIQNYQAAEDRVDAMKQLIYSHLAKSKGPQFDPSGLYEADAWLETIDRAYPAEAEQMGAAALRVRIRESDADRMLEDARWYLKRADEVSAKFILKRLLRKYPATAAGQVAFRFMIDKKWIQISTNSTEPSDQPDPLKLENKIDTADNENQNNTNDVNPDNNDSNPNPDPDPDRSDPPPSTQNH